jgi:hypothetical protein
MHARIEGRSRLRKGPVSHAKMKKVMMMMMMMMMIMTIMMIIVMVKEEEEMACLPSPVQSPWHDCLQ